MGLKVAANKQRIEDHIQMAIEDLRDRLPEMTTYEQVYPDKSLGEDVAKVFSEVVVFARVATLYCKGYGYCEWDSNYAVAILSHHARVVSEMDLRARRPS